MAKKQDKKTTSKKTTSKKVTTKATTKAKTPATKKAPSKATAPKKSTSKPATKPTVKKAASKQTTTTKPGEYMLRKSGLDKEGNQKFTAIRVYKRKPNGWKEDKGATTAPVGYKWISNGKSLTSGERKSALVRVNKG